jgi:TusA-related sulfurtransferase
VTERLELDCRGMRCPQPVIALARALAGAAPGTEVAVAATDPAAATDIAAWCRMRGAELVAHERADDGTPVFVVR